VPAGVALELAFDVLLEAGEHLLQAPGYVVLRWVLRRPAKAVSGTRTTRAGLPAGGEPHIGHEVLGAAASAGHSALQAGTMSCRKPLLRRPGQGDS